jgi:hypothetical protein
MADTKDSKEKKKEFALNTNEVMNDYEFYLKMYIGDHKMDFEPPHTDLKAS